MYRDLSPSLVDQMQTVILSIEDFQAKCDIMMATKACHKVPILEANIKRAKKAVDLYGRALKDQIKVILCKAHTEEQKLREILAKHYRRPFHTRRMKEWLERKNNEVCLLNGYYDAVSDAKFVKTEEEMMREIELSLDDEVVCLELTIKADHHPWIGECESCLQRTPPKECVPYDDWLSDRPGREHIQRGFAYFKQFMDANKQREHVRFIVYTICSSISPISANIKLYKEGKLFLTNYIPPAAPKNIKVTSAPGKVLLEWDSPDTGGNHLHKYRVLWRRGSESAWNCCYTDDNKSYLQVRNLRAGATYVFRIAGECHIGRTPDSEEVLLKTPRLLPGNKAPKTPLPAEVFESRRPPSGFQ